LYYLAVKKLTAAKEVLNKLPPDSIDIVVEVWARQLADGELICKLLKGN
jgi:hypothetical protein